MSYICPQCGQVASCWSHGAYNNDEIKVNPSEPSPDDKPHEHWRVEVSTFGEQIVAIETEMLAGREISEKDAATIELCARHLLGFIGK